MAFADASEVTLVRTSYGTTPPGVVNADWWSVRWITLPGTADVKMATTASMTCGALMHRIGWVNVQLRNAMWTSRRDFQVLIANADLASADASTLMASNCWVSVMLACIHCSEKQSASQRALCAASLSWQYSSQCCHAKYRSNSFEKLKFSPISIWYLHPPGTQHQVMICVCVCVRQHLELLACIHSGSSRSQ